MTTEAEEVNAPGWWRPGCSRQGPSATPSSPPQQTQKESSSSPGAPADRRFRAVLLDLATGRSRDTVVLRRLPIGRVQPRVRPGPSKFTSRSSTASSRSSRTSSTPTCVAARRPGGAGHAQTGPLLWASTTRRGAPDGVLYCMAQRAHGPI